MHGLWRLIKIIAVAIVIFEHVIVVIGIGFLYKENDENTEEVIVFGFESEDDTPSLLRIAAFGASFREVETYDDALSYIKAVYPERTATLTCFDYSGVPISTITEATLTPVKKTSCSRGSFQVYKK